MDVNKELKFFVKIQGVGGDVGYGNQEYKVLYNAQKDILQY